MIKDFKFLTDNDDDEDSFEPYDGATWIFGRMENLNQYQYDVVVENYYGIRSFLNQFPVHYIVTVISITGPNGLVHNADNDGVGWGFDILGDLITVEWIRFRNQ